MVDIYTLEREASILYDEDTVGDRVSCGREAARRAGFVMVGYDVNPELAKDHDSIFEGPDGALLAFNDQELKFRTLEHTEFFRCDCPDLRPGVRELLRGLRDDGVNDIRFPDLRPELEEFWGHDNAVLQGLDYAEDDCGRMPGESPYFDYAQFQSDVKGVVCEAVGGPGVTVQVHWDSGEIEVYRK